MGNRWTYSIAAAAVIAAGAALIALRNLPSEQSFDVAAWASRCFRTERVEGQDLHGYVGDRLCEEFGPPRPFRGVWLNDFEDSRFIEGATSLREVPNRDPDRNVWLSLDEQSVSPFRNPDLPTARAYYVEFIGRKAPERRPTREVPGYGHLNTSPGLVLVDRMTRAVDLGPLPRPQR